jgi:hypothetical protein
VNGSDYADLLARLFVDLCAIGALNLLLAWRRPQRGLFLVFTAFNVGVFALLAVIAQRHIGPAVGFGLFALLSIVRLRSEPFSNAELSYFFCALVLALINGLQLDEIPFQVLLDVVLLATLFFVDHPALYRPTARRTVTLDEIVTDDEILRRRLSEDLDIDVVDLQIEDIDYVRELTRVQLRYVPQAASRAVA